MSSIAEAVQERRNLLDEHTREIVQWHFGDDTGSQFWLEKKKTFDFDPLTDVTCFDDLKKFPFTTKADLRSRYPFGMLALPTESA